MGAGLRYLQDLLIQPENYLLKGPTSGFANLENLSLKKKKKCLIKKKKPKIKVIVSRSYCCYGNLLCHKEYQWLGNYVITIL